MELPMTRLGRKREIKYTESRTRPRTETREGLPSVALGARKKKGKKKKTQRTPGVIWKRRT